MTDRSATAYNIARTYLQRGWAVVPVQHRSKEPALKGWPGLRLTEAGLSQHFSGRAMNIGVHTGTPSHGLTDIDLDWPEASALAPRFLPPTGAVFGRPGKPRSHVLYYPTPIPKYAKFTDPTVSDAGTGTGTGTIVEIRTDGHQTVFPGSVHPSGEAIAWERDGEPARVDGDALRSRVARLAACCLLARHWPQGARQDAALFLAGGLLRAGWAPEETERVVEAVAMAAGDEESGKRRATVAHTRRKLDAGEQVAGWPHLAKLVGDAVVTQGRAWLGLGPEGPGPNGPVGMHDRASLQTTSPAAWPVLRPEALHGLAGDVVHTLAPHTEADPVAVLLSFLAAFGSAAGAGAWCQVGTARHHLRLWPVLVGATSKGRKGTSWEPIQRLMELADAEWAKHGVTVGLSTGEGLIWVVRDPVKGYERVKEGKTVTYQAVVTDHGVPDKRLLVIESEFATVLKQIIREGNILSPVLRQAWDSGNLRTITKTSSAQATGAHISILGHVTQEELRRYLTETEAANGFGNRFLWCCVRRSKVLPEGGDLSEDALLPLAQRVRAALDFTGGCGLLKRDEEARAVWAQIYPELSEGKAGLVGALCSRAEAQALRLSGLYAVLDGSRLIRPEHLLASLALWDYCEASAAFLFGKSTGDAVADTILTAIRERGGMTRSEILDLFARHQPSRIAASLKLLKTMGLLSRELQKTGGRPAERWTAQG